MNETLTAREAFRRADRHYRIYGGPPPYPQESDRLAYRATMAPGERVHRPYEVDNA